MCSKAYCRALYNSWTINRTSSRKPTEAWGVGWRTLIPQAQDGEDKESQKLTGPTEANQLLLPTWRWDCEEEEKLPQLKGLGKEYAPSPQDRKGKQFLEPKHGCFHCKDCKMRWESAYVWCITGANKVYSKQICKNCQKSFNPYRVEAIQCQTLRLCCSCSQKKRHIDLQRPHSQELCGHCKDKKFSCFGSLCAKVVVFLVVTPCYCVSRILQPHLKARRPLVEEHSLFRKAKQQENYTQQGGSPGTTG
ncbi:ZAR1-like protein [Mastomys coucha]|uniref:ZAR1-like protein n=1 Tax=Mastomys coucha TaxID=35658 RepID=UPI001261F985|nr:ZAR1-like protein [Mastomys coucha]